MTIQTTFFDWARSGLDWNAAPYESMAPNLLALNTWLVTNFGGQALGLDDFDREIRTGGTISDHAYGAALDWRYEPGWLPNTSPLEVSRPEALKLVDHIIDWSAELHVQRIHDYVGDRIWTAGRTSNVADAHGAWWKPQNGAGSGMGESWARYFHFATDLEGWNDGRPVTLRGVPLPGPQPTPDPDPTRPPPEEDDDMADRKRFVARKSDGRFYQGFEGLGEPQSITRKTMNLFLQTNTCYDAKTGVLLWGTKSGDSISLFSDTDANDQALWSAVFLGVGAGPK